MCCGASIVCMYMHVLCNAEQHLVCTAIYREGTSGDHICALCSGRLCVYAVLYGKCMNI